VTQEEYVKIISLACPLVISGKSSFVETD